MTDEGPVSADFPAAHSMDTTWFAVDRDGHVACLDSGEAGAVPLAVQGLDLTLHHEVEQLVPPTSFRRDLKGWQVPGPLGQPVHWLLDHPGAGLLFLSDTKLVKRLVAERRALLRPATEGTAVLLLEGSQHRRVIAAIHKAGHCLGCFFQYVQSDEERRLPGQFGLFLYDNLEYVRLSEQHHVIGPYGRQQVPDNPLHVDQLPPALRQAVLRMRFRDLCFAEASHIQPVEFSDCDSWGDVAFLNGAGDAILCTAPASPDYRDLYEAANSQLPAGLTMPPPPPRIRRERRPKKR